MFIYCNLFLNGSIIGGFNMKKIMIGVLSLVLISLFAVGVLGIVKNTVVGGIISDNQGVPVDGAQVLVECSTQSNDLIGSIDTESDSDGQYGVEFDQTSGEECYVNDTVTVNVGPVTESDTVDETAYLSIDLVIINVSIPEFTVMTAGIALTGALFGLSIFRKHKGE